MKRSSKDTHPLRHLFTIAGMALVTVIAAGLLAATAFYARSVLTSGQLAAVISAAMVDMTNDNREEASLGGLRVNEKLVAAAQAKADDMAAKGYFAHDSPDGTTSWKWFYDAGYSFAYAGENLAVDFSDSEDVVEAWMASPTHRANIMNDRFTEIGIATAVGTYKGRTATFVVQMFGTPANEPVAAVARVSEPSVPEETAAVLGSTAEGAASIATDAEPVPAYAAPVPKEASLLGYLAASPKALLRTLYAVSAILLLIALAFVTRLQLRRHHTPQVFATGFLMLLMAGLFLIADRYVFVAPTIGSSELASDRT